MKILAKTKCKPLKSYTTKGAMQHIYYITQLLNDIKKEKCNY